MNPFDPNFKGQIPTPSAKERGYARASRSQSKRMQAVLDRTGPAQAVTRDDRAAQAVKTAKLVKVGI